MDVSNKWWGRWGCLRWSGWGRKLCEVSRSNPLRVTGSACNVFLMNTNQTTATTTAPVAVGAKQFGKILPAGSTVNVRSITKDGQFAVISDNFSSVATVAVSTLVF